MESGNKGEECKGKSKSIFQNSLVLLVHDLLRSVWRTHRSPLSKEHCRHCSARSAPTSSYKRLEILIEMVSKFKPGQDGKKEEDKGDKAGAAHAQVEIKIAHPAEDAEKPVSPPLKPAKVEIKIESVSALLGKHGFNSSLHPQLKDLEKAKYVEKLPHILIKKPEDDEVQVEVIVIVSFADTSDTLIHSGNFILQATDNTTLKEIKIGISKALDIHYEHMSIACGKRFLSDLRTLNYYCIFDGVTIHLLVDTPDDIFENVFKRLLIFGHDESVAAIATRSFIAEMNTKYNLDEGDNPVLTEELLMFELGRFHTTIPLKYDSDVDSDDSTDEDYSIDENEYPPSVFHIGELELLMMQEEKLANNGNIHENLVISNMHDNFVNDEDGSIDEDEDDSDSDKEDEGNSDSDNEEYSDYVNDKVGNCDLVIKDDGDYQDDEGHENYVDNKAFLQYGTKDTDTNTENDDSSDEEDSDSDSYSDGL